MQTEQIKILAQNKDQLRNVLDRIKAKGVVLKNVRIYRASDLDKMSFGSTHTFEEAGKKIILISVVVALLAVSVCLGFYFFTDSAFSSSKNFLYALPFIGLVVGYATSIIAGQIYASSHEKDVEISKDEIAHSKLVLGIEYDPSQKNLIREVIGQGRKIFL